MRRLGHLPSMPAGVRARGSVSAGKFTKPTATELANPFKSGQTCLSSREGEALVCRSGQAEEKPFRQGWLQVFCFNILVKED